MPHLFYRLFRFAFAFHFFGEQCVCVLFGLVFLNSASSAIQILQMGRGERASGEQQQHKKNIK